jgi:hypothetical protein
MSARGLAGVLALASSCATVAPLQLASVAPAGSTWVSGQVSGTVFCGSIPDGLGGFLSCNQFTDGVPLPELRANVRHGVGWASDVGASVQVLGNVGAPEKVVQVGLTLDAKRELLHLRSSSGLGHVLSLGVLAGAAIGGRLGLAPLGEAEWAVPLRYGLQVKGLELVSALLVSQRVEFGGRAGLPAESTVRLGASVGLFRREPLGWAVQLGYLTDPRAPGLGSFQLQLGWQWDVTPR